LLGLVIAMTCSGHKYLNNVTESDVIFSHVTSSLGVLTAVLLDRPIRLQTQEKEQNSRPCGGVTALQYLADSRVVCSDV